MNSVLVPSTPQRSTWQRFIHYLFDEEGDHQSPVIMILILFNAFVLFLHSFPDLKAYHFAFELVDHSITLFFIIELLVKIRMQGWRRYFSQSWHKMDFALVLFSAPSLLLLLHQFEGLIPNTEFLLILRTLRILKFYRLIEFIPNFKDTIRALNRALRASVFLISAFLLFNFVVSLFTYHIFKDIAPNNFGNGLVSFYSTMKTVAGEGFEVAEKVVGEEDARAMPSFISTVTRFYFLFIILTGGIIGLSLVNTVFINEVTKENNHELEEKLSSVQADMTILKTMLQQLMSEKSGLAIGRLNPDNPTNQPSDPRTRLPPNQE